jgi:hypothetical protein
MYSSTHSLTSALDEDEWSASRPGRFTPRERAPGTYWLGGWVGPRAGLDAVKRKIPSPRRESNLRDPIVQPAAQRYTDWAITAQSSYYIIHNYNSVPYSMEQCCLFFDVPAQCTLSNYKICPTEGTSLTWLWRVFLLSHNRSSSSASSCPQPHVTYHY